MRWNKKLPLQENNIRTKKKFLLFPKCINDKYRWLEIVEYKQKYIRHTSYEYVCGQAMPFDNYFWENVCWVD
jgi:hypothetical protein